MSTTTPQPAAEPKQFGGRWKQTDHGLVLVWKHRKPTKYAVKR